MLQREKRITGFKIILLVVVITILTTVTTVWLLNRYLFPKTFEPVTLSLQEEQLLEDKIKQLDGVARNHSKKVPGASPEQSKSTVRHQPKKPVTNRASGTPIAPEPYREDSKKREIRFTEREINALLAHNTDLADKVAIDLSKNLASARLLIPLDPDFPILGGKTLRVSAGLEIRINEQKPVIKLRGVSFWGVPLPNAWLGGIKNVNLINELEGNQGFWDNFAAGVKAVHIQEGSIFIELKK